MIEVIVILGLLSGGGIFVAKYFYDKSKKNARIAEYNRRVASHNQKVQRRTKELKSEQKKRVNKRVEEMEDEDFNDFYVEGNPVDALSNSSDDSD